MVSHLLDEHAHVLRWISSGHPADIEGIERALTLRDALDVFLSMSRSPLRPQIPSMFTTRSFGSDLPISTPRMLCAFEEAYERHFRKDGVVVDCFGIPEDPDYKCLRMGYASDVVRAFFSELVLWDPVQVWEDEEWKALSSEEVAVLRSDALSKLVSYLARDVDWGLPILTHSALRDTTVMLHRHSKGYRVAFGMMVSSSPYPWTAKVANPSTALPHDQCEHWYQALSNSDPILACINWSKPQVWKASGSAPCDAMRVRTNSVLGRGFSRASLSH
jgi:hypothetical protein